MNAFTEAAKVSYELVWYQFSLEIVQYNQVMQNQPKRDLRIVTVIEFKFVSNPALKSIKKKPFSL